MNKSKYIEFKVKWKTRIEDELNDLNFDSEPSFEDGTIYWREDLILGVNNGEKEDECFLIVGIDPNGYRENFRVAEPLEEVIKKLNG